MDLIIMLFLYLLLGVAILACIGLLLFWAGFVRRSGRWFGNPHDKH